MQMRVLELILSILAQGDVYLKFMAVDDAAKGVQALNGRMFSGQRVVAKFISEPVYKAHI